MFFNNYYYNTLYKYLYLNFEDLLFLKILPQIPPFMSPFIMKALYVGPLSGLKTE